MDSYFIIPWIYAKIVQAEHKGSLFTLLSRSLSYAKINIIGQITSSNVYAISIQAIIFLFGHWSHLNLKAKCAWKNGKGGAKCGKFLNFARWVGKEQRM